MKQEFFAGKKVLIMGLGRFGGGVDVAGFAHKTGARVTVTDLAAADKLGDSVKQLEKFKGIEFHLGGHDAGDFQQADVIIVNPAVPGDNEFLQLARQDNKIITTQINIFFELCSAVIIGITGANGKSTTAALTAHLLKAQTTENSTKYKNVWLSGNIGNEPLLAVIDQIKTDDVVVLELSSFQCQMLEQIQKGPQVALLTNLTPNHLDRHGTFADYCAAKENIFKFQRPNKTVAAVSLFCGDDKIATQWLEKYSKGDGRICIKFSADDISGQIREQFGLAGRANLSNLAAAVSIARYFGVTDAAIINCLAEFKTLPHRLEPVAKINGIRWYNDSIATTPQSTIAALEAFEQPMIIIVGGYDKNLAFDELGEKIAQKAKAAILIGRTSGKIAEAIEKNLTAEKTKRPITIETVDSLADAVNSADRLAGSGDVVLLSPACASYDMFDNFQHRGCEFIKLVRQISN